MSPARRREFVLSRQFFEGNLHTSAQDVAGLNPIWVMTFFFEDQNRLMYNYNYALSKEMEIKDDFPAASILRNLQTQLIRTL